MNLRALEEYVTRAGAEADVVQLDKHGQPRGTLRELARSFVARLGGQDRVTLTYRHSRRVVGRAGLHGRRGRSCTARYRTLGGVDCSRQLSTLLD